MRTHEERLQWYKSRIEKYTNSKYLRDREYGAYLARWFDERDDSVDGMPYAIRMNGKHEPMSELVYWLG